MKAKVVIWRLRWGPRGR